MHWNRFAETMNAFRVRLLILLLTLAGLLACSPAIGQTATIFPASPTPTAPGLISTIPATLPYEACGWVWAQQSLPDVSSALQKALSDQQLPYDKDKTYAYAYGENCLNRDGKVDHFAAMETDFVVATGPAGPGELAARGDYAGAVLKLILEKFKPAEAVPGPQPGVVDFIFTDSQGETQRRVELSKAQQVLASGLSGEALYQALFP